MDIERLWREHNRMLEALRDIAFKLPRLEALEHARNVFLEVMDNAVQQAVRSPGDKT
jgi:hypothetical protein